MPYIDRERREELTRRHLPAVTPGELTYLLTATVDSYLADKGHELCFADLGEVVAALECAKLEFYRRIVGPYESDKIVQHGDVYTARVQR